MQSVLRIIGNLYFQVLVAIALGILVGYSYPAFGASLQPLGLAFVNMIKIAIGPVVFLGVAAGGGEDQDRLSVESPAHRRDLAVHALRKPSARLLLHAPLLLPAGCPSHAPRQMRMARRIAAMLRMVQRGAG